MNLNLYSALRASFPADLDAVAIEAAGLYYTWRDLERGSAMIANLLGDLGLPPGSRVAVQTEKSVEALLLYLAVLRAGHVFVPLNTAYQAAEIAYFIADAAPAVFVCASRHFGWISRLAFQAGTSQVYTLDDDRSGTLLARAAAHSDQQTPAEVQADDLAALIYTSGTTGRSKGAMLSHGNLLSNAQVLKTYWGWRNAAGPQGGDVLVHALPIFHVHGLFVAVHGALLSGSRMIWFARFDAAAVLARLPDATVFMGVPTMYGRLLAEPGLDAVRCSRMRLFISGSAPLLAATFRQWQQRTGHTILERYGMSETVMLTSNPCDPGSGERRGGTVGFPLPGVDLRLQDERGQAVPVGEIGGIQVRGPNVFQGYWRQPEKTRDEFAVDAEGRRWFKTGDVGMIDGDGYVTIVGRSKDLIISGGYNVYPAEVEGFLNALPGVAESAVIGAPHPDLGEAVMAVVVPRGGADAGPCARPDSPGDPERFGLGLVNALRERIAHFKIPKRIVLAAELPRNAMGKVQKNLLREQHRHAFAD